jgi:hypothetical protein
MNNTKANNDGDGVKTEAGLWVDHREAVVVVLSKTGEQIRRILSNTESQPRRSGEPATGRFEHQAVPSDDSRQREYTGHLARYYDDIISHLCEAGAIVIFGPGEAKGELKKRLEKEKPGAHVVATETTDKMTEPQIVAHVRHHFEHDAARRGLVHASPADVKQN